MLRHSSYFEVCLPKIAHNISLIREHYAPKAALIPMIKGDSYGHGLVPVADYLDKHCQINNFGVASLGEAMALLDSSKLSTHVFQRAPRDGAGGKVATLPLEIPPTNLNAQGKGDKCVYVFSDTELLDESIHTIYASQNKAFHEGTRTTRLAPVLPSMQHLDLFCKQRNTTFQHTPLCLKVNTGMGRLGLTLEELERVIPMLKEAGGVDLLLQHFSTSGLIGHSFTARQYANFQTAKKMLKDAGVDVRGTSCANSGAIEQRLGVDETHVRPGLMLYGPSSIDRTFLSPREVHKYRMWDGKVCGRLFTKVIRRYVAHAGSYIGYGVTRNLVPWDAVIVLMPIGYADGFLRYYTGMPINVRPVTLRDADESESAPPVMGEVHGNVNMDLIAVAVYPHRVELSVEEIMDLVKPESEVMIWGQDIAEKARIVKSIPYQLSCALTTRVPRTYVY